MLNSIDYELYEDFIKREYLLDTIDRNGDEFKMSVDTLISIVEKKKKYIEIDLNEKFNLIKDKLKAIILKHIEDNDLPKVDIDISGDFIESYAYLKVNVNGEEFSPDELWVNKSLGIYNPKGLAWAVHPESPFFDEGLASSVRTDEFISRLDNIVNDIYKTDFFYNLEKRIK